VEIDALVSSSRDRGERYVPGTFDPPPRLVVRTAGGDGGTVTDAGGGGFEWEAAPLPGPAVDAYGSGDSFAAGLTYGLGDGRSPADAVALGARCGAASITGRGPYEAQLTDPD
jgi:ribokinase